MKQFVGMMPPPASPPVSPPPRSWVQVAHIGTSNAQPSDYSSSYGSPGVGDVWWRSCEDMQALTSSTTGILQVTMGSVHDYFRPASNYTLCEMLASRTMHEWSPDSYTWFTPEYAVDVQDLWYGGSAAWWPQNNVEGDGRAWLSIWGVHPANQHFGKSGCCSTINDGGGSWNQHFDLYVTSV